MTLPDLLARMRRSPRTWTYAQMTELSSARGVATALGDGRIVRILTDQYSAALHARSFTTRALGALAWAGPRAALAGTSALHWWDAGDAPEQVLIASPWEDRPRGPGWLRVRRFVTMPESVNLRGARVLHPDAAVVTAHSQLAPGMRAEALYRPLRIGLVTPRSVGEAAGTIARVRGRAELESRLRHAARGSESHLEERADARVLRGPVLGTLIRQHRVMADGELYRLDAFDPGSLTALEFDGFGTHGTREAQRRDKVRDARLASVGIQTMRFAYEDVTGRPEWCRRLAEETIMSRRHRAGEVAVPQDG